MKKNTCKYIVSTLLFIDICSISVLGMMLAFVIPGGEGPSANKYFLGLHRHEWGDIHLYLSLFLLLLLIVHIWFNWKWISQSTILYFGKQWKNALYFFCGAWLIVIIILWTLKIV